ncbi:Baculovirus F protein [Popillia japonica]|uniref:Baculovirus F protein n=1 Tax=Popillia japonica TaxID=7064 RepID=A0AAW1K1H6_POPJA
MKLISIILVTATIKLMNSQLPVHQIENYILLLKLGQSRIIQSYHSFIYKIEADKLFSYVNKIKEQMNLVNTTYMKKRYPPATTGYNRYKQTNIVNVPINSEHEIGKDQSMYDLIKQTKNLIHRTENKLVNIFPTLPTLPRSKRPPLDIIGYIGNQLFGFMDHEEKQRTDNALSVIGRNQ